MLPTRALAACQALVALVLTICQPADMRWVNEVHAVLRRAMAGAATVAIREKAALAAPVTIGVKACAYWPRRANTDRPTLATCGRLDATEATVRRTT